MIIINTNPKNPLLQKVKEELDFLGVKYEIKKSWTDELIKQCFINNFEFCSGHYMGQIRKLNFNQALELTQQNPKMLRKFIVINGNKAIADFPKTGLIRKQLKGFYLGNSLKYLLRHQKKNGLEDLKKARKNLDWLIDEVEKELNNDQ